MVSFDQKIIILGCGSVAQCALPLIFKYIDLPAYNVSIIDYKDNRPSIKDSLDKGVTYIEEKITPFNYQTLLQKYLNQGDICLDLSVGIDTASLLDWCHHSNVMYMNTSAETWSSETNDQAPSDISALTEYARLENIYKTTSHWQKKGPTAIINHGANPGLVSHFTKQGLIDIAQSLLQTKDAPFKKIENALSDHDFAQLAYLADIKTIHVAERDTQIITDPKKVNEFVNTWSIPALIEESTSPAELFWGTHERHMPALAREHDHGPQDSIYFMRRGMNAWAYSWVPSGNVVGMVISHPETLTIGRLLTLRHDNRVIYRPTVAFIYCPCDAAINSLHELQMLKLVPQKNQRIIHNEIVSGQDEVGCLLMGHHYTSWWIGSQLDIAKSRALAPHQNATTLQVAAGILGALVHMINNRNQGFCNPEDLDHREILTIAKPLIEPFVSYPVHWTPLANAQAIALKQQAVDKDDKWQFVRFLVDF